MTISKILTSFVLCALVLLSANLLAAEATQYSPYVKDDYPNRVYFGDTHLHTSYSTDAGMIADTLGPAVAYRFALGEVVTSSTGLKARLQRPLDFLVIADHAESLGLAPMIAESNERLLQTEIGKQLFDLVKADKNTEAYGLWSKTRQEGGDPLADLQDVVRSFWERLTSTAEQFNDPGKFTALIGFEWTSMPQGRNLHRVVIFRDNKPKADQQLPITSYDTWDPEELWGWMADYEQRTGGRIMAIPHNGNLSNGLMFDSITLSGEALDRDYAERRARWEPLYEATQIKGDGEAHPLLSPTDEFADFETWDKGSFGAQAKTADMLPREYARAALKNGLAWQQKLGVNPFKFGMIGSTDSHTSLATTTEDNYFGKVSLMEPLVRAKRMQLAITGRTGEPGVQNLAWQTSASGLAAVWARENTREALWDAMARKEVYATTGTRIRLRLFAGWDFNASDLNRPAFAKYGYANGVPMGGDLNAGDGTAPGFLIQALRDPDGANLDRIQIIKGWLDSDGKTRERIYDVAVSDGRKIDANGRCSTPVGNSVDTAGPHYSNSIGESQLEVFWKDPDFDRSQRAFYYVRVLEIPSPRWTLYDAIKLGTIIPAGAPATIQERAYSSPVWYTP